MSDLHLEIKRLIVEALNLEDLVPEEIDADAPLFGNGGLGLDSIDALELGIALRRKFGIKEGTRIQIEVDESAKEIILKPITSEFVHSLRGKFKGKGLLQELMAEKERERKL